METGWLDKLRHLVEKKPLIILIFDGAEWDSLRESRRGVNEFTVARRHDLLKSAKPSTPCLIWGKNSDSESIYFGLISSRSAITTLDSRLKIRRALEIQPSSQSKLIRLVKDRKHAQSLTARLRDGKSVVTLTPKLSSYLIEKLASIASNQGSMRAVAESLFSQKCFRGPESFQEDALLTAFKTFGLAANDRALSLELVEGRETALARVAIMEDLVIQHDARRITGYELVKSDLTGRAVFEKGNDRLEVFTANRAPLEKVFGVDLIYLNLSKQNIVMLQYKMLEPQELEEDETDWIYRPDAKLDDEIGRMKQFAKGHAPGPHEYRLNPAVFYLKFVKRDAMISSGGIVIPLDHFERLRADPSCRGPKGGLRVSYKSLSGRYLRQNAFMDLIRSGYIGAHADITSQLRNLIEAALNNGRALVAAIQQQKDRESTLKDDPDFEI
jgi:hypothetical protein